MVLGGSGLLALSAGSVGAGRLAPPPAVRVEGRDRCIVTDHDFDDCFRASYARLVRLLTAASGDAELAADCVQESFVRAHVRWRKVGRYEDPVGWVRRVALNLVRDHARTAARKRRAHDRLAAQGEAEPGDDHGGHGGDDRGGNSGSGGNSGRGGGGDHGGHGEG